MYLYSSEINRNASIQFGDKLKCIFSVKRYIGMYIYGSEIKGKCLFSSEINRKVSIQFGEKIRCVQGVYLSPINSPTGPWHTQILENFKSACQIIHRFVFIYTI